MPVEETPLQKATDCCATEMKWLHDDLKRVIDENIERESKRISWQGNKRFVDPDKPAPYLAGMPWLVNAETGQSRSGIEVWRDFLEQRNRAFILAAAAQLSDPEFIDALHYRLRGVIYYSLGLSMHEGVYHFPADALIQRHCIASQWLLSMGRQCITDCHIDTQDLSKKLGDIAHSKDEVRNNNHAAKEVIQRAIADLFNCRPASGLKGFERVKRTAAKSANGPAKWTATKVASFYGVPRATLQDWGINSGVFSDKKDEVTNERLVIKKAFQKCYKIWKLKKER